MGEIKQVLPALESLSGADVSITGGGMLLLLLLLLLLPDRWRPLYTGASFRRLRADRDEWKARALKYMGKDEDERS